MYVSRLKKNLIVFLCSHTHSQQLFLGYFSFVFSLSAALFLSNPLQLCFTLLLHTALPGSVQLTPSRCSLGSLHSCATLSVFLFVFIHLHIFFFFFFCVPPITFYLLFCLSAMSFIFFFVFAHSFSSMYMHICLLASFSSHAYEHSFSSIYLLTTSFD